MRKTTISKAIKLTFASARCLFCSVISLTGESGMTMIFDVELVLALAAGDVKKRACGGDGGGGVDSS